jgi:hydrogenase nickel incorporation protein HypA/HybF
MHELSIVLNIIDTAIEVAEREDAQQVETIELQIGELAGVDENALLFAWGAGTKNTVLDKATLSIERVSGKAFCSECQIEFPLQNLYDGCPVCKQYFIQVTGGKELKIKSLTLN